MKKVIKENIIQIHVQSFHLLLQNNIACGAQNKKTLKTIRIGKLFSRLYPLTKVIKIETPVNNVETNKDFDNFLIVLTPRIKHISFKVLYNVILFFSRQWILN